MQRFLTKISNRLDHIDELRKAKIGFEFEFYSKSTYYKTLELLNLYLAPIKVTGYKEYHSTGKLGPYDFKLEPDFSGGPNMCELITSELDYDSARIMLIKILKWMQTHAETNERSSIHINISFEDLKLKALNPLKLILDIDENWILFGYDDRKNNVYAKSVKKIIPIKHLDFSDLNLPQIQASFDFSHTKYHGINFENLLAGRIEWRYLGGKNYQYKISSILERLDYFVLKTRSAIEDDLYDYELEILRDMIDEYSHEYKSLSTFEDFMAGFSNISLQIDKTEEYQILTAYYHQIFPELFEIMQKCEFYSEGIINWDTARNRFEIVDAEVQTNQLIEDVDFIGCQIQKAEMIACNFVDCEIKNSILVESCLYDTDATDCRLEECQVDRYSHLDNCYFLMGRLDGEMEGGVFRSGTMGKNAWVSSKTQIMNDDNFFGIKGAIGGAGKSKFRKKQLMKET